MKTNKKRIAIMVGAGFVPGINAVIKGAAIAAAQQGWEVVGIRDGFAGLLRPDHYSDGGLVDLNGKDASFAFSGNQRITLSGLASYPDVSGGGLGGGRMQAAGVQQHPGALR